MTRAARPGRRDGPGVLSGLALAVGSRVGWWRGGGEVAGAGVGGRRAAGAGHCHRPATTIAIRLKGLIVGAAPGTSDHSQRLLLAIARKDASLPQRKGFRQ